MTRRNAAVSRQFSDCRRRSARGFTLVEMLIAMAITLVMVGAVVTLFANISNSVRNRRAVVELSGQVRHARNMLQQDLQGATCNGLVWQRPDENQGYIEIIEGPHREGQASVLVDGLPANNNPGPNYNPEIDHTTSLIPASNLPFNTVAGQERWVTDGGSLGDYDDILMLTVRNEHEPFVGRVPLADGSAGAVRPSSGNQANPVANAMPAWKPTTTTSPLAEVIWYAIENPSEDENTEADNFFGEPGMRTIYRRTLLIAPFFNPYRHVHPNTGAVTDTFRIPGDSSTFTAKPGLVRVLPDDIGQNDVAEALACLVAFQERYDLSVRLEFDPLLGSSPGRWKIVANTLGDLTKRENRYEHHFYRPGGSREYPFGMIAAGSRYDGNAVRVVPDPEVRDATGGPNAMTVGRANLTTMGTILRDFVSSYRIDTSATENRFFANRPFAFITDSSDTLATARVMLNDQGEVIRIVHGPVPLSGERKGEDVMLSDALGFDLRVYDPGAPIFAHSLTETVLQPTDPAWLYAYVSDDNMGNSDPGIGRNNGNTNVVFPFIGQGAYVDLGYGFDQRRMPVPDLPSPRFATQFSSATLPWFFTARPLSDVYGNALAPGYAVFDTWSFHYENNGLNEDGDTYVDPADGTTKPLIDEGTNGLDDPGHYINNANNPPTIVTDTRLGPDDVGERETSPPYDKPLRGIQAVLRLYERDSRQVRQVSVNQTLVPE